MHEDALDRRFGLFANKACFLEFFIIDTPKPSLLQEFSSDCGK